MCKDLQNYVAFITGGSSGLGYEMAKQLASQGAEVIIGARSEAKLEKAKAELSKVGRIYTVKIDVTDEDSVKKAAEYVSSTFKQINMVVSNAGIGRNAPGMEDIPEGSRFYDIPVASAKAVIETNMLGTFIVSKYFVPLMLKQGFGSFVYVSTSDATISRGGGFPYGPSKGGAQAFAYVMMDELKDSNIKVNIICPGGFVDTPMYGVGVVEKRRSLGRAVLEPSVLNKTIAFLASDKAKDVYGEKIIGTKIDEWLKERNIDFDLRE